MTDVLFFARNCWVRTEVWDGALSWWSSQVCSRQSSGRHLRTFLRISQLNREFAVWFAGTDASRYHICCIDIGDSPEYFGYYLLYIHYYPFLLTFFFLFSVFIHDTFLLFLFLSYPQTFLSLSSPSRVLYRILLCVISSFPRVVDRTALFWVTTQRVTVISCRRFGTTYPPRLQGSSILDSWTPKVEPLGCPETLAINYHYPPRDNQEGAFLIVLSLTSYSCLPSCCFRVCVCVCVCVCMCVCVCIVSFRFCSDWITTHMKQYRQ
jgi:hypothetical protein